MAPFESADVMRNVFLPALAYCVHGEPRRDAWCRYRLGPQGESIFASGGADAPPPALRVPVRGDQFTVQQMLARDHFSDFFDGLERFHLVIEQRLARAEDIRPHLQYWLEILATPSEDATDVWKSREYLDALWRFVDVYSTGRVRSLMTALGYEAQMNKQFREAEVHRRVGIAGQAGPGTDV